MFVIYWMSAQKSLPFDEIHLQHQKNAYNVDEPKAIEHDGPSQQVFDDEENSPWNIESLSQSK